MNKSGLNNDGIISKWVILVSVLLLSAALLCGCTQDTGRNQTISMNNSETRIVFNDSYDNRIELSHTPTRIIALNRQHVQMLILLGAADKIVGTCGYQVFHEPLIMNRLSPDVKDVGAYTTLNSEAILQLNPDVILSYGSHTPSNIDAIKALNLTVVYVDCYRLAGLNEDAYILGELTGKKEEAQRYIRFNQKYMDLVESRLANLTPDEIPTAYSESLDYYALTSNSNIGQTFSALHIRIIYDDPEAPEAVKVSAEWIVQKNPDIITKTGSSKESFLSLRDKIANRTGFKSLKAVQSNQVYIYNNELVGSSPRGVIGLVYFAKAIYPNRFADIDPDAVRREYNREFGVVDNESMEWFYPPFNPINGTKEGAEITTGG